MMEWPLPTAVAVVGLALTVTLALTVGWTL